MKVTRIHGKKCQIIFRTLYFQNYMLATSLINLQNVPQIWAHSCEYSLLNYYKCIYNIPTVY